MPTLLNTSAVVAVDFAEPMLLNTAAVVAVDVVEPLLNLRCKPNLFPMSEKVR